MLLPPNEFFDKDYYKFIKQTFDAARYYLKTCGKPKDEIDVWFIKEAKFTVNLLKKWVT